MKNRKGFTIIEILAVFVVLAIVTMITYAIIQTNISSAKKSSFETSVKNVIEAAREYVVTNFEDNDFPEGGIDITNNELDIKNNTFIAGVIMKTDEGTIEVVNLTDGEYCANGTKGNLEVTKGACEAADTTPPDISVKVLKKTPNSVQLLVKMQDAQSGLKELTYCMDSCKEVKKVALNNERSMVKKVIEIKGLKSNKVYKFKFTLTNNYPGDKDIKTTNAEYEVTLPSVEAPKISVSAGSFATTKLVTIKYPEADGFIYSYTIGSTETRVPTPEAEFEISSNATVKAIVSDDNGLVTSSELYITGLDNEPPKSYVYIENRDAWTDNKKVYVKSVDEGAGLALRAYSLDKKKSWIKVGNNGLLTTAKAGTIFTLKTRDKIGNIQEKFYLCDDAQFKKCDKNDILEYPLKNVDKTAPGINISVSPSKADGLNGWYKSNVTLTVTITDAQSGVKTVTAKKNGSNFGLGKPYSGALGSNKVVYRIVTSEDGATNFSFEVKDVAGNKSTAATSFKKDSTPPTTYIYIANRNKWTESKTVSIKSTDTHSGLDAKPLTISNISGAQAVKSIELKANQTLSIQTKDKNGNVQKNIMLCANSSFTNCSSVSSVNVNYIDNIKPKMTIEVSKGTLGANNWYTSAKVTLKVTITDTAYSIVNGKKVESTGSGIKKVTIKKNDKKYNINPSSGSVGGNSIVYKIEITDNGKTAFDFETVDQISSHEISKSKTIKKDNEKPTLKFTSTSFTGKDNKKATSFITTTFGVSGKDSVTCKPETVKTYKKTSVTCTAKGKNGLEKTVTKDIRYKYDATAVYKEVKKEECGEECEWHDDGCCDSESHPGSTGSYSCNTVCHTHYEKVFDKYTCPKGGTLSGKTCTI